MCHVLLPPWKQVTKKFGSSKGKGRRTYHKPYLLELVVAAYYALMTAFSVYYRLYVLASFCFIMTSTFTGISFGDYLF